MASKVAYPTNGGGIIICQVTKNLKCSEIECVFRSRATLTACILISLVKRYNSFNLAGNLFAELFLIAFH